MTNQEHLNSNLSQPRVMPKVSEIKTSDRQLLELIQLSETVARSKATVLIQGAPGTGKKLFAELIHQKSQRSALPLQVLEEEKDLASLLSVTRGGTLLILEVSKLSMASQSRLFQAMQDGSDIRFLATSTRDLGALVKQGEFREDLFYRLNVVNIQIPNLASRLGDVEILAKHFVVRFAALYGKTDLSLAQETVQLLGGHTWPGNVRELESTIERAVLLTTGNEIRARDIQILRADALTSAEKVIVAAWKPGRTLDEIERNVILEALKYHDGNRTHTAKALGISIRTLRNKLAEYRVMGINA